MTMFAGTGKTQAPSGHRRDTAGCLRLAAAPTFGSMAWISATGVQGWEICSSVPGFLPVNDMTLMYVLMGVFHLPPWLKLMSARSRRFDIPTTQTEGE
ncbi:MULTISPECIES: hypothetical protein [unclassified Labrenzia]|uniref:hypothetical protein n=1 Tax=unclassified Labrenzia TaxID=2648686 RepID=UPI00055F1EE8|nr:MULTISPECIES: hypothetical protein [unclassified Labrenzia]